MGIISSSGRIGTFPEVLAAGAVELIPTMVAEVVAVLEMGLEVESGSGGSGYFAFIL
jgi:hypothetical protein